MSSPAWTSPPELRDRLRRDWASGRLASAALDPQSSFPMRIGLKAPGSSQLDSQFQAVRDWIKAWMDATDASPASLEWKELDHRVLGKNRLPCAVSFDSPDSLARWTGLAPSLKQLRSLSETIVTRHPALTPWCRQRPLLVLAHASDWPALLACLDWFLAHPRPGVYLRQIDAPGVHSKFIETHRALLAEVLDLVLPPHAIDTAARGAAQFNQRYGLRDKPVLVRCRFPDPASAPQLTVPASPSMPLEHCALSSQDLARLTITSTTRVFITENETNFLAFPTVPDSIIIFGAGYGFEALKDIPWLQHCPLYYLGDLDTHGYAILDQLRASFPGTRSLLMDQDTLLAHQPFWTNEPKPVKRLLPRLSLQENLVYQGLCNDTWGSAVRLEQERIAYHWLEQALSALPPS